MTKQNLARALAIGVFATMAAAAFSTTANAEDAPGTAMVSFAQEADANRNDRGVLRYVGTNGADRVGVDKSGDVIEISHLGRDGEEPAPLIAGPGCYQVAPDFVTCSVPDGIDHFYARLADGDDSVTTNIALNGVINGGSGNDKWRRNDAAGPGAPASSMTFAGGAGTDTADYLALRDLQVSVTKDDLPNDGTAGDSDNIMTTVETVLIFKG